MTKPVLVREDFTCGPAGLKLIEEQAANGRTQRTIAAALGVGHRKFERMLERGKGENPERLAWERGHAVIEQRIHDALYGSAMGTLVEEDVLDADGAPTGEKQMVRQQGKFGGIHLMFYAKTRLGWQEKPTGALIQDNRINITLPASMSTEDYYKMAGKPVDYRRPKNVTPGSPDNPFPALPAPAPEEPA